MSRVEVPYLDRLIPLDIPEDRLLGIALPNDYEPPFGRDKLVQRALDSPFGPDGKPGGRGFRDFLAGAGSVLVVVNDQTRPTPTEAMLDALLPALGDLDIGIVVATGAHRGPTEAEYRRIFGHHFDALRPKARAHDARDESRIVELGRTRSGTPIGLNRIIFEYDRIVATGSVEPHYFAGFTGGRKAFLPGLAAFRTIEANHERALDPRAVSLALEGNPVHEDMLDALPLIKAPIFSLMAVLDKEQRLAAAAAGDLNGAFTAAAAIARRVFCVAVPARAEVVVSVARFPMDIDLYQSQKAIDNGALALADGGSLILVSSCRDGLGDEAYAELLASSASPADAIERIRGGFRLGYHKAAKMAQVSARARIVALTELPQSLLKGMFIEAASDLQAAIDEALGKADALCDTASGKKARVLVLPDGCLTVPEPAAAASPAP
jgi:nickel-dependent lactate racemase